MKLENQNVLKIPRLDILNCMDCVVGHKSKHLHSAPYVRSKTYSDGNTAEEENIFCLFILC